MQAHSSDRTLLSVQAETFTQVVEFDTKKNSVEVWKFIKGRFYLYPCSSRPVCTVSDVFKRILNRLLAVKKSAKRVGAVVKSLWKQDWPSVASTSRLGDGAAT